MMLCAPYCRFDHRVLISPRSVTISPCHCLLVLWPTIQAVSKPSPALSPSPHFVVSFASPPRVMFKRANKPPRRRKGICFGDDDAEKFDLEASVVIDGSGFATTTYTHYDRVQVTQPSNLDASRPDGRENISPTSEQPKVRKQVSHPISFMLLLNDTCSRVHLS